MRYSYCIVIVLLCCINRRTVPAQEELDYFGIDWTGPVPTDSAAQVHVPSCRNPLPRYLYDVLVQYIDPFSFDVNDSEEMYINTRTFVQSFGE